jgi:hypothetical protein
MRYRRRYLIIIILLSAFAGCTLDTVTPLPPTDLMMPLPVPNETSSIPIATSLPRPLSEWEILAPGMERRSYFLNDEPLSEIIALRIDPANYLFRVHYRAGESLSLARWVDVLPGMVALVNANFFDPDDEIVGLLIADGVKYGWSYQGYGGLFAVQDGMPRVRSNVFEPYSGESLEQAVQAFPMLVLTGQPAYTGTESDRVARRTVVGQDTRGRIILMVTPYIGMTLADLSAFLVEIDLHLVNAFNLDGGGSTMMGVLSGERPYFISSFDPVPAVLAVYAR